MSRNNTRTTVHAARRRRRSSNPFVHIRRILETRLRELLAIQQKLTTPAPTGMALLASTPERVQIGCRIDEARELADRIGALAYQRYGQMLTLSEKLVAAADSATGGHDGCE